MESAPAAAPLSAPMTLDAWRAGATTATRPGSGCSRSRRRCVFPRAQVWGDVAAVAQADAAAAAATSRRPRRVRASATRAPTSSGRAAGSSTAWPATPDDDAYARVRDSERRRRCSSAASSTARRRPRTRPGSCCRTCPTATRSCCRASATRPTSGRAAGGRQPLVNHFLDTGRSTPRATRRRRRLLARRLAGRARRSSRGAMVALALVAALSLAGDGPARPPARAARPRRRAWPCAPRSRSCSGSAAGPGRR